jgi:hypothetical protein
MDAQSLEFFQRVMDRGVIDLKGRNSRWCVMYDGHYFSVSKVIYYLFNPDVEPLSRDEEIHHKDHNRMNDHPDNLMRVTKQWHTNHHRTCVKNYPTGWPDPNWVSPILVRQMKELWLSGVKRVKEIWKALFKVIGRAAVRTVVLYHQRVWAREEAQCLRACA